MNSRRLKITNARIVTPYHIIRNGTVLISDGKIEAVAEGNPEIAGSEEYDAQGNYVSPGFIDLHLHGGGGHDFMDNQVEGFLSIASLHAAHGTTAFTPTTLSSGKEALLETLTCYEKADQRNKNGAAFIGIHIEGPYFAMEQRGAQDPRYIKLPDPDEYREILGHSKMIRRWSAAPELKGAIEFGKYIKAQGILPSIAHTNAIYEEVLEAYQAGYTHVTHFYSAMSGVSRRNAFRYAGVIESAYLLDDMTVEVIADGVHLPAPLLQLIYKIKGPEKIALITDAMRAAGMPPGESVLGRLEDGLKVIVEDGVAKLPDRTAFAGSVATTDRLVRNMIQLGGVPLADAIRMITATPASIMGIADKKGAIEKGKDADLVIFDDAINIHCTIIGGRVVYDAGKQSNIK